MNIDRVKCFLITILIIVLVSGMVSVALAMAFPCEGTANTQDVKVRAKSSTTAKVIAKLKKGETIKVVDEMERENGDVWYQVETAKGKTGYVLSDYLAVAETDRIDVARNSSGATLMSLTVKATCADYNGVGKNWTQYYEWNGIQAADGQLREIALAPDVEFSIYSRIREQDKKPDTGMEKSTYTPTAEELALGFTVEQKIIVTENTGKNKGNKAIWNIDFIFSPTGKSQN